MTFFKAPGQKVFQADWCSENYNRERNFVQFARATFTKEELLDYLEASKLAEKVDFLCQTDQEIDNFYQTFSLDVLSDHWFAFE